MDKGLTVPKWVLIFWPKIPQIPQNLFSRSVQLAQKFGILLKKGFFGRPQSVSKDKHRRLNAPVDFVSCQKWYVCMSFLTWGYQATKLAFDVFEWLPPLVLSLGLHSGWTLTGHSGWVTTWLENHVKSQVLIFWEGHKILQNLHLTFDCMYCS